MNLNLQIIHGEPEFEKWNHLFADSPFQFPCVCPQIYQKNEKDISPDYVYLIQTEELSFLPRKCGRLSLICLGMPDVKYLDGRYNLLYSELYDSPQILLNQLLKIFAKYADWTAKMQTILDQRLPLREIGELSFPIFRNPIYLQGASYLCIFHIKGTAPSNPSSLYNYYVNNVIAKDHAYLPLEEITTLASDPEYIAAAEAAEATIYSGRPYGFRTLFYNLKSGGVSFARVCIDEIITSITERDFSLLTIMSHYLEKGMQFEGINTYNRPSNLDYVLSNLLNHHLIDRQQIASMLGNYQWNEFDTYFCMILRNNANTSDSLRQMALAAELTNHLPSECYLVHDGDIVFVFNLTQTGRRRRDILDAALPLLRDNLLMAGNSSEFNDFKNLYYYYQQALYSLRLGQKYHPMFWYFHFNDYHLQYVIHRCKGKMIPEALIPDGLTRLLEYDAKKGTDYAHLLRVYLENHMNIADTIRQEYMHRNTFLYRIQRIQNISRVDLGNYDTCLSLQIGYKILQEYSDYPI